MAGRVLMAMSGGVDSSVAAALLVEQGYEVIGVTMNTWTDDIPEEIQMNQHSGCCSLAAVEDARSVAHKLGIPYYVMNFQGQFARHGDRLLHSRSTRGAARRTRASPATGM